VDLDGHAFAREERAGEADLVGCEEVGFAVLDDGGG